MIFAPLQSSQKQLHKPSSCIILAIYVSMTNHQMNMMQTDSNPYTEVETRTSSISNLGPAE